MQHPSPYCWKVVEVDNDVWEYLVENAIKKPYIIAKQVAERQAKLKAEGDNLNGEIARIRKNLEDIDTQRAFYQIQGAKGFITEKEFERRMNETKAEQEYWQDEIERLKELRDNAAKVNAGLDYAYSLLAEYRAKLDDINQTQEELDAMPFEQQQNILRQRQTIMRALCDKVYIHADGKISIEGIISPEKVSQFELSSPWPA
jgi:chromosome segregation ATPase